MWYLGLTGGGGLFLKLLFLKLSLKTTFPPKLAFMLPFLCTCFISFKMLSNLPFPTGLLLPKLETGTNRVTPLLMVNDFGTGGAGRVTANFS